MTESDGEVVLSLPVAAQLEEELALIIDTSAESGEDDCDQWPLKFKSEPEEPVPEESAVTEPTEGLLIDFGGELPVVVLEPQIEDLERMSVPGSINPQEVESVSVPCPETVVEEPPTALPIAVEEEVPPATPQGRSGEEPSATIPNCSREQIVPQFSQESGQAKATQEEAKRLPRVKKNRASLHRWKVRAQWGPGAFQGPSKKELVKRLKSWRLYTVITQMVIG